ncbi:MAG TPA: LPS export ABC transporter periplasmic protein LptC [Gammaproteobacteria bacterium]|nr:LPS export ABC transporter periplasmic protein LptC [Gammaproteobacteria bacterium]
MTGSERWTLSGVLVISMASLWLYLYSSRLTLPPSATAPQPDLTIEQPHWLLFDARGRISRRLQATRLEQWAGEDGARLFDPRLRFSDSQQRPWLAEARHGRVHTQDDTSLLLEQQVVLRREQTTHGPVIKTGRLHIAQHGDRIETDDAVELDAGSWHFTSNGLRTDLGKQRLELLARVRGIHE